MVRIKQTDIDSVMDDYEAGITVMFKCPECKQAMRTAEAGWWDVVCQCGYKWSFVLYAEGHKFDD